MPMKCYQINGPDGLDALVAAEIDEPVLGPYDVLVQMKAWSLNYRDLSMPFGGYVRNDKVKGDPPLIPLSDGVGEVIQVGASVKRFSVGERVAGIFFQDWLSGDLDDAMISSALGGAADGVLSERICLHENGLVKIPSCLSYSQAATLPCAAVTAWQSLTLGNLTPGETVLMLGTGGVSIFALQFAKLFGARAIITSSSDEKLEHAKSLGADVTINYKTHPEWHKEVLRATDGRGVDHVIEVGGAGTLEKSLASAKVSGRVNLIGVLTGQPEQNPSPMMALFKRLTVQGIYVGSRDMFEAMNRAIDLNRLTPVIDREFGFDEVRQAYEYLHSGKHFGKVVIHAG
jgi:NADPH:quinone reductase-like Zn-dependent oxidoreductase